jgi:tripartite-type tricarboxylate transporter receptor subunit TctC
MTGVNLTTVPDKGAAPAITDLIGGQIQVMFTTVASAASLIEAGQLRALAVTSVERSPAFPDLPTVSEAGLPCDDAEAWYGLFAPAKTPQEVIDCLNKAATAAVKAQSFKKFSAGEGLALTGCETARRARSLFSGRGGTLAQGD